MLSLADGKSKKAFRLLFLAISTVVLTLSLLATQKVAAQEPDVLGTNVGVTVCGTEASQVTLTKPISDSVVTEPTVTLEGMVSLASQLEITVDGAHNGVIPLSIGQTAFTGSVQLTPGTHTIQVTAINVCSGANGVATAVVTYTVPPQTPSTGEETPTTVGGVVQGEPLADDDVPKNEAPGLLEKTLEPLKGIAQWLNVDFGVEQQQGLSKMSVGRAITLTAGMYLSVIGIAPAVITQVASLPVVASIFHIDTTVLPRRLMYWSRIGRVVGVGLVLGALFL